MIRPTDDLASSVIVVRILVHRAARSPRNPAPLGPTQLVAPRLAGSLWAGSAKLLCAANLAANGAQDSEKLGTSWHS
ncbi:MULTISPECIES: hypothetical protein [unclassified Glutamicibacter]|uniref:hypothetical protein n=1 Tax=unclassified Glutamicibacter TaxID=2627139 RepID=UPI0037FDFD67